MPYSLSFRIGYTLGRQGEAEPVCRHGETTRSSMSEPVRKMVLLSAEKGRGVPVRHWRPDRSPGLMVPANATRGFAPAASDGVGKRPREAGNTSDADWSEDRSGTRRSVTQRNRSRTEKTTERGTATCLTGCESSHITRHGDVPRPIPHAQARGSGKRMGKPRGGTACVNGKVCLEEAVGFSQ